MIKVDWEVSLKDKCGIPGPYWKQYVSHLPVLDALLATIDSGVVVELGAGYASTRIIRHWVEQGEERKAVSVETDKQWTEELMRKIPEHARHEMCLTDYASYHEALRVVGKLNPKIELLFVDGHPFSGRLAALQVMARFDVRYVVFHDAEALTCVDWCELVKPRTSTDPGEREYTLRSHPYFREHIPPEPGQMAPVTLVLAADVKDPL